MVMMMMRTMVISDTDDVVRSQSHSDNRVNPIVTMMMVMVMMVIMVHDDDDDDMW